MAVRGEPLVLDDWQRQGITEESDWQAYLKARQVGFSFCNCAAKAVARSMMLDKNLSVFVSMNLDDAREKIIYSRDLHDSLPAKFKSRLTTDNKMELGFKNGSRIVTMFMPRGKGPADIYVDEFAYMKRAKEIYTGAVGMTLRGGQLTIGSTPVGKSGMFYDVYTCAEGKFTNFKRIEVPWWLSSALCIDVKRAAIEAPHMTTHERVYAFGTPTLITVYENTFIEDFQQECELSWGDDQLSFYPIDLIFKCVDPELTTFLSFEEFRANLKGIPRAGFDVGRRKNPSVLIITEEIHNKNFVRMILPMYKMGFDEQKHTLSQALEILPIIKMCIDETGIGMNLAEDLAKKFPHIVIPVNFAGSVEAEAREDKAKSKNAKVAVKERLATNIRIALERGDLVLPQDKELIKEIHSVKRDTSITGRVSYDVEKNERHHGDRFWALALALFEGSASKRSGIWW